MKITDEMVEAAWGTLCKHVDPEGWPTEAEVRFALEAALEAAPQWIACEERMPEEAENVVVCGVDDPPAVAYWYADLKGIQWCVSLTGDDITDVTHWMPLPAAPRSER